MYLCTPSIPKSIRPSPFFFRLESNAFPDIRSFGRIKRKKLKKKFTRSAWWHFLVMEKKRNKNKTKIEDQRASPVFETVARFLS